MINRRLDERLKAQGVRARIRLGHRLALVDVSPRGALVEGRCPMRPGSRIDLQLETDLHNSIVAARVLRCAVAAIEPERGVTYRAAVAFAQACDWVREVGTPYG